MRSHPAPRRHGLHRQAQPCQHALGLGHFCQAHLFEIQRAQPLGARHRQAGVHLNQRIFVRCLCRLAWGHFGPIQQRLCRPLLSRLGHALFLHAANCGQHGRHHMFHVPRVAPVEPKDLGKDRAVLRAVHETGVQRPVKVQLVGKPRRLHRADGVNHPARPNRQPRPTQGAGEMGDVARQLGVFGQFKRRQFSHKWLTGGFYPPDLPKLYWKDEASGRLKRRLGLIQDALGL